ncbi:MAG TPA: sensor histidine kinase [Terriglobia bacterium]|nr:sensor histidine kinase [Terriglobia bacterium]
MKTLTTKTRPKLSPYDNPVPSPFAYAGTSESVLHVPNRLALIDSQGNIVAVNKDWIALAEKTGTALNRVGPGANYFEVCRRADDSSADSRTALNGIYAVLKQRASSFAMDYPCHTPSGPAAFHMAVTPITYADARVVIAHTEVSDLQLSESKSFQLLQQFARHSINAQEEERQRISREIHDDVGNRIALMALSIRQIFKQGSGNSSSITQEHHKILDQITELSSALRDLSHGLHPPVLRHLGIKAALRGLHEKFETTHGIHMNLMVVAELRRLPDEVALCIFRITQESLQNVVKHSGADTVTVVLDRTPSQVRLTVSDTGRGFIRSEAIRKGGLGLLSMEARALCIGGRLTVDSAPGAGTEIRLTIPRQERVSMVRVQ